MKQVAVLLVTLFFILMLVGCGGGNSTPNAPVTHLADRVFISNTYSGNLQVMDSQSDTTANNPAGYNSQGQLVNGAPITISVSTSTGLELRSPDKKTTAVVDPVNSIVYFISNDTEVSTGGVSLSGTTNSAVFSADSSTLYAAVRNAPITGGRSGGIQKVDVASLTLKLTYSVPNARYVAITPNGNTLLVFSDTSDSVFLIDLTAASPSPVEVTGFARPVNAIISSDNNTAYVLNCGPECGSTAGPASVAQFDLPSHTIKTTVPVGGATVGLLNNNNLYVAGNPGPAGTIDVIDVTTMKLATNNSIPIGDGYHSSMALAQNNMLYIGANTCSNTTSGCLSFFNTSNNTPGPPSNPNGPVTGMVAIPGRNVIYAVVGGYLMIFDTTTNKLGPTQLVFQGTLSDVVLVDQ